MKLLVLTDHRGHSAKNSLYALVRAMLRDPRLTAVRIASRGTLANGWFFDAVAGDGPDGEFPVQTALTTVIAAPDFAFAPGEESVFAKADTLTDLSWPDVVLLRVPHPVPDNWGPFLRLAFGTRPIYNRPEGVATTTDKSWLLNVAELCPTIAVCETPADITAFAKTRDTVLKPLYGYGGQGLVRILGDEVTSGNQTWVLPDWLQTPAAEARYLAMQYLPRVGEGDKRIVVVGGEVIGAVLRVPAPGQWLANVSQGAQAEDAEVSFAERRIIDTLSARLLPLGIVMYGIDTLVGLDGERVLSEVNTMSVGGLLDLKPIATLPAVDHAARLLLDIFSAPIHVKASPPERPS